MMNFWLYAAYGLGIIFLALLLFIAVLFIKQGKQEDKVDLVIPRRAKPEVDAPIIKDAFDKEEFAATRQGSLPVKSTQRLSSHGLKDAFGKDQEDFSIVEGKD